MKPHRLSLTTLFLALVSLAGVREASACKYCMSAENAEAAAYNRQAMSSPTTPDAPPGSFPLDSAINQFKSAPAPTALATPPAPDTVLTNAADLRAAKSTAPNLALPAPASTVAKVGGSAHFADAGLLGLAAVGGVFCWRTRRKTGPGR